MIDKSTVTIELDGESRDLVCTLDACLVISRTYGGINAFYERVKNMDIDALSVAVRAGLMVDGKEAKEIPEKVFRTGLLKLMPQIAEFVLLCASGGVRPGEADDEGGESEKPGKS